MYAIKNQLFQKVDFQLFFINWDDVLLAGQRKKIPYLQFESYILGCHKYFQLFCITNVWQ